MVINGATNQPVNGEVVYITIRLHAQYASKVPGNITLHMLL